MNEIGKIIKGKREEKNLTIEEVARFLRIKPQFIIAIENGNEDIFSAQTYYYGYLKQYLKLLDLEKYHYHLDTEVSNKSIAMNIVEAEHYNPSLLLVILSLLITLFLLNKLPLIIDSSLGLSVENFLKN